MLFLCLLSTCKGLVISCSVGFIFLVVYLRGALFVSFCYAPVAASQVART